MASRWSLRNRATSDMQSMMNSNGNDIRDTSGSSPSKRTSRPSSDTSQPGGVRPLRLTLRMPPGRPRDSTGSAARAAAPPKRTVNIFADTPIITGPRSSRAKKKIVEVETSDDDDDDDLQDQEEDEVDDDEDAPGEEMEDDMDADGDVDMDDVPPQPPVSRRHTKSLAPPGKPLKSVEAKEMEMDEGEGDDDDDDEELSELESDAEGEPDDQDEGALRDDTLGANGDEEELDEEDEEDEEEEVESDEATPVTGSRLSTPDYSKLTKRQRGTLGNDFLQLPMGA